MHKSTYTQVDEYTGRFIHGSIYTRDYTVGDYLAITSLPIHEHGQQSTQLIVNHLDLYDSCGQHLDRDK